MERSLATATVKKVGQKVKLAGWVERRRDHGKLVFIDLIDRSGIVQVVGGGEAGNLRPQDVIEIVGEVAARPKDLVNPKLPTGKVEVRAEKINLLAAAAELPFDMGAGDLEVSLPTLLDHRALTLRHRLTKAIFKVQEVIVSAFRASLKKLDFVEIQAPTIVPTITEGGAEVFKIDYYGRSAFLAQSPQLYKQIAVGAFERVFTLAHAYRAEPSETTRHLTEYLSLDCEMGFINNWQEILDVAEIVTGEILKEVEKKCPKELEMFGVKIPQVVSKIPRIKLQEAQEVIFQRTSRDIRGADDLDPEAEREICRWSAENKKSDLVFVTHYPTIKRPFYTMPDPENSELTLSFDLIGKGLEWVTGGQRINDYSRLVAAIRKSGNKPEDFAVYLEAFKFGMPPEGGFAAGVERITMRILELDNVRQASLFPRDMTRIDLPLTRFSKRKSAK